jgi:putative sterol carrier protein
MTDQPDLTNPANIASAIDGRTDDEINALTAAQGVENVLSSIFTGMAASFAPERAAGQSAVIQYDLTAPDGTHSWLITVAEGACTVAPGTNESSRITIGMTLPDFLQLTTGKLDGMTAFMSGKLRVGGDMMFAPLMQTWFQRASSG